VQGRVFGTQALIDLLLAGYPAPVGQQLNLIFSAVDLHRGLLPIRDDIVLFLARAQDSTQEADRIIPFVYSAEKRNVRALATHIRQVASSLEIPNASERNNFLSDLELAVSEIATNIVIHAYRGSPYTGRIQGRVTLCQDRILVDLVDSGRAFSTSRTRESTKGARSYFEIDPPTGGYGLALARRLTDVCEYERIFGERNHWHLEKMVPERDVLTRSTM
jgi:anti-sigma regulatory factor (Ser/Thr protein kinase)